MGTIYPCGALIGCYWLSFRVSFNFRVVQSDNVIWPYRCHALPIKLEYREVKETRVEISDSYSELYSLSFHLSPNLPLSRSSLTRYLTHPPAHHHLPRYSRDQARRR